MADVELIIKVPEELLDKIDDENYQSIISWYDTTLYSAIKNGIVLPQNATNGDRVKALLGKPAKEGKTGILYKFKYRNGKPMFSTYFDADWWNAPCKVKSEDE